MAIFNEVEATRYARFFQKLLSIKGAAPVRQIAGEYYGSISLFNGVENRYLEGWQRFGAAVLVPAVAANNSVFRLRNPAGSSVIAVLEKATFSGAQPPAAVPGNPTIQRIGTTDFATLVALTTNGMDTRHGQSSLVASQQNTAPFTTGATLWFGAFPGNQAIDAILTEEQEIPLLPGDSWTFRESQVNVAMTISVMWRERVLEQSEFS